MWFLFWAAMSWAKVLLLCKKRRMGIGDGFILSQKNNSHREMNRNKGLEERKTLACLKKRKKTVPCLGGCKRESWRIWDQGGRQRPDDVGVSKPQPGISLLFCRKQWQSFQQGADVAILSHTLPFPHPLIAPYRWFWLNHSSLFTSAWICTYCSLQNHTAYWFHLLSHRFHFLSLTAFSLPQVNSIISFSLTSLYTHNAHKYMASFHCRFSIRQSIIYAVQLIFFCLPDISCWNLSSFWTDSFLIPFRY